jgi:hypothetical protein
LFLGKLVLFTKNVVCRLPLQGCSPAWLPYIKVTPGLAQKQWAKACIF